MSRTRWAGRVRWALCAVVPAEVALVVCLVAGVPVPAPVVVAAEALVVSVLAVEAAVLVRLLSLIH
ncbi:hypothetical protein ACSNOF_11270, partial [Streptomyces sp. URMC 125]